MSEPKSMDEYHIEMLVRNLDGLLIGRLGINKGKAGGDVWLTIYDDNDEELSFRPAELLAFCQEVVRIADEIFDAEVW
jgi:hypothetical protein